MPVTILFMAVIAALGVWWLLQQRLTAKPWLEEGVIAAAGGALPASRSKTGLRVFLGVVGSLFALLTSAYLMRMGMADWRALPIPRVLWLNTGVLVLSSVALHAAKVSVRRGQMDDLKAWLLAGGLTAMAFLAGQFWAWRQLNAAGYFVTANPADSFFYLMTGLHGLHIIGGLIALAWTADRVWNGAPAGKVRLSVEMCATYWHFLLALWLFLFMLLAGWADDLAIICRELLT